MKRLLIALCLLVGLAVVPPVQHVSAFDFGSGVDCSNSGKAANPSTDPANSAFCHRQSPTNPIYGKDGIIMKATNFIAYVAGIGAIIVFIVGGIRYITSNGDSNNVASAKNAIINAAIGLIVIVTARQIINFILNRI